jgi:hypothetical protein
MLRTRCFDLISVAPFKQKPFKSGSFKFAISEKRSFRAGGRVSSAHVGFKRAGVWQHQSISWRHYDYDYEK